MFRIILLSIPKKNKFVRFFLAYKLIIRGDTKGGNGEKCTTVPLALAGKYKFKAEDKRDTLQRLQAFS